MSWYHPTSKGIKVSKPTHIFLDKFIVMLNATNPGSTPKKKTVALSYHFVRENVANNVVEMRKIHSSDYFSYPFTKTLARNYFHGFYHDTSRVIFIVLNPLGDSEHHFIPCSSGTHTSVPRN